MNFLAQSEQVDPGASIGFLLLWIGLAAGLAFWGYRRAQEFDAPGWVGALTVFVVSMACSLIGGLLAVYLLVPLVASLYPKRLGSGAPAPYTVQAYGSPPPSIPPTGPVQPDAQGFVTCPGCGARGKAGRRSCMSCGASLTG